MKIFFIGAGAVGTSMALACHNAGHEVLGLSDVDPQRARDAAGRVQGKAIGSSLPGDLHGADVVFVAVPDPMISQVAARAATAGLGDGSQVWLHLSGAFGANELSALGEMVRGVGTFHPALVFAPGIVTEVPRGTIFAVDANCQAVWDVVSELGESLGGTLVNVKGESRSLYHASLVFASNYLAGLLSEARALLVETGLRE